MKLFGKKNDEVKGTMPDAEFEVFGTGCKTCEKLYKNTIKAAEKLGVAKEVCYVTDIKILAERGIMDTPALALDGKIISSGKLLSENEICSLAQKEKSDK